MITRFAPSPTGPLHVGHAYSAWIAHDMARAAGGQFLLRIEDIDRQRAKPAWEAQILDDLAWLGITWDTEPVRQSDRMDVYRTALDVLWDKGLLYSCTCTRRDIADAMGAPQEGAPMLGPDGLVYPGTCRPDTGAMPCPPRPTHGHLRLNMARALRANDRMNRRRAEDAGTLQFLEVGALHRGTVVPPPEAFTQRIGDVVLARKDFGTSYHLSVVLDDAAQGVTHVVRGADLFEATPIHVMLQRLLGLSTPIYHHHDLVRDAAGKRLAKRDDARSIASYRQAGWRADDLRAALERRLVAP
ncbi:MAG: tRNA glutamyl-Q(34) synthetase GluQRS [Pseudomonadota bacterium]